MPKFVYDPVFLGLVLDAATGIGGFVVAQYAPQYAQLVAVVWGGLQPLFLYAIKGMRDARQEIARLKAQLASSPGAGAVPGKHA